MRRFLGLRMFGLGLMGRVIVFGGQAPPCEGWVEERRCVSEGQNTVFFGLERGNELWSK